MISKDSATRLTIEGLSKRFPYGENAFVEAVKHVSFTAQQGEFIAVMGASGSGKSTLLHLVGGLTKPTTGHIHIAGQDINALNDLAMTRFRRKHIGLIFQAFNLIPSLTAEENIALPALLSGAPPPASRVDELMIKLGLEQVRGRRPDTMSGGEQQRIAIGRALINEPALILADEPTGSLDSRNGRKLSEIFRELCAEQNVTVLMVTHNPTIAFAADRFVVLKDGELVGQLQRADHPTVQDLSRAYVELTEGGEHAA